MPTLLVRPVPSDAFDLLILGAGVIGLACAREIHRRHPSHRLAILDAPTGALPASRAAAGMLAPYAEFDHDSALARWCAASLAMYPSFVSDLERETGLTVGLHHTGTLVPEVPWAASDLATRAAAWTRRGIAWRWLEGKALQRSEPAMAPQVTRAVWLPEGGINSRLLHAALMAAIRATGVTWIEGRAVRARAERDHVAGVHLDDGRFVPCRAVLAATGAWTTPVADLLDLRFSVRPIKGQIVRVAAPDDTLRHVIHAEGVYIAPWGEQGIVIGSTMEDVGFDGRVDDATVASLRARATTLVPAIENCPVAETWAGFRPKSEDGLPIIGWSGRWANVMVATGHFRNGILLTPATASAVAQLYENPNDPTWEAFSPERPELHRRVTGSSGPPIPTPAASGD